MDKYFYIWKGYSSVSNKTKSLALRKCLYVNKKISINIISVVLFKIISLIKPWTVPADTSYWLSFNVLIRYSFPFSYSFSTCGNSNIYKYYYY